MPYLNIDDGELDNPKIETLTDAAYRLYSMARLYCARNLTDGQIPLSKLRRLTDTASDVVITELERSGLMHLGTACGTKTCPACTPGWAAIHDYLEWNHSKAWWLNRRKVERERKDEYRRTKRAAAARRTPVPPGVPVGQDAGHPASGDAGRDGSDTRHQSQTPEPEPIPVRH